jgi:hypothetical protein
MPTIHERDLIYQSFDELPELKRYRVMVLLPFVDDPMARLILLRQICRSRQAYTTITTHPRACEIIVDLFTNSLAWLRAKPKDFTFRHIESQKYWFSVPDARFSEVTFGSLVELDSAFSKYLRTQREDLMNAFLAELYTIDRHGPGSPAKAIEAIPYPYRLDAFRMYAAIREKVFTSFRWLFPNSSKEPSEKEVSKPLDFRKIQDTTPMWHSVLFSLAESPAYQGMHTSKAANMWEALTYLDEKAFQAHKQKEKNHDANQL